MNYKEEIQRRGYKIYFVAEKIGIDRSLLSQYINKARSMPEHIERKLKEFLR